MELRAWLLFMLLLPSNPTAGCKSAPKPQRLTATSPPPTQNKLDVTCEAEGSCLRSYQQTGEVEVELRGAEDRRGVLHHDLRVDNSSGKCYKYVFSFRGVDDGVYKEWIPEDQLAYDIVPNYSGVNLCQAIEVSVGIEFELCQSSSGIKDTKICTKQSLVNKDCIYDPTISNKSPITPILTWLWKKKEASGSYPSTTIAPSLILIDWGEAKQFDCRKTKTTKGIVEVNMSFLPKKSGRKEESVNLLKEDYNYFENIEINLPSMRNQCKNYQIETTITMEIKSDRDSGRLKKHSTKFVKERPPLELIFPPQRENGSVTLRLKNGMDNCSTVVYKVKCYSWRFGDVVVPLGKEEIYEARNLERTVWIADLDHKVCRAMAYFDGYEETDWSKEFFTESSVDPAQVVLVVLVVLLTLLVAGLSVALLKCFYSRKELKEERDQMKAKEDRQRLQQNARLESQDNNSNDYSDDYSDEENTGKYQRNKRKVNEVTEVMYEDPDEVDSSSEEEYQKKNLNVVQKNNHKMRKIH